MSNTKIRNPYARKLREGGQFTCKVIPAKKLYKRREKYVGKHYD